LGFGVWGLEFGVMGFGFCITDGRGRSLPGGSAGAALLSASAHIGGLRLRVEGLGLRFHAGSTAITSTLAACYCCHTSHLACGHQVCVLQRRDARRCCCTWGCGCSCGGGGSRRGDVGGFVLLCTSVTFGLMQTPSNATRHASRVTLAGVFGSDFACCVGVFGAEGGTSTL